MKISLSIGALGCVFLGYLVLLLLSGDTAGQAHLRSIGKPLRQKVAGNGVLILPLDYHGSLFLGRLGSICWLRTGIETSKVSPLVCDLHGITEAHLKDGPVRSIWLKAWDVCWELLNGGRCSSGWR